MELTIIVVFFVSILTLYLLAQWISKKRYPPGPFGVPILGHLPLLGNKPEAKYLRWWKQYGDVVGIRLGSWKAIVINGFEAIKEASERKDDVFSGRPDFVTQIALREVFNGMDPVSFANFSPKYLQLRKWTATALRTYMMKCEYSPEDLFRDEAEKLAQKLLRYPNDEPVTITLDIEMAVESVVYQMLYGKGKEHEIEPHIKLIVESNDTFSKFVGSGNIVDVVPWLRHFMKGVVKRFKEALLSTDWITKAKIKEHTSSFQRGQTRDVLDAFCAISKDLPEEESNESISSYHLMHQVANLQGAGFDTTSRTMLYTILYMIAFPEVQVRVQNEIDSVLGGNKTISWKDRENLPYVYATILEVMRKTTIVPFALPHFTLFDTKFRGYDIEKDTVVLFNLHSVANEKSFWGDPENFRPERLLDENGLLDSEKCAHVLSFSAGRRRCVAELLAKMNVFIMFTTLMQRCEFKKENECDLDLEPIRRLVLSPKPFKVLIEKRHLR